MFNATGYLDAGLHEMTIDDFETAFVTPFPYSTTRSNILVGFVKHHNELSALLSSFEQFVDGSFTTNKNDPNDVDLLVMADGDLIDSLSEDDKNRFAALVNGKETQKTHLCDAYFLPVYPDSHPQHQNGRAMRKYWMGEFGFDRSDVPKGIVQLKSKAGV